MAGVVRATEQQYVAFELAGETYGVDIACVREIYNWKKATTVPQAPSFVEGVINLRGSVVPVIDLRKRFGLPETEPTKDTRIVVVEMKGLTIGMVVDAVSEVLRISSDQVEPPPPVVVGIGAEFIVGVAKLEERLIILVDLEKVLSVGEQAELKKLA